MTVKELIEFLKTIPQDAIIANGHSAGFYEKDDWHYVVNNRGQKLLVLD